MSMPSSFALARGRILALALLCAAPLTPGAVFAVEPAASAPSAANAGHPVSQRFVVTGAVKAETVFDLAALRALPPVTRKVGDRTYTGASLWALLDSVAGIAVDPGVKNDILSKVVVATGSDGYRAVFSIGELHPAFGNAPDLVAYEVDGAPLGADGFARLVAPADTKGGRNVASLVRLEVFSVGAAPTSTPAR